MVVVMVVGERGEGREEKVTSVPNLKTIEVITMKLDEETFSEVYKVE